MFSSTISLLVILTVIFLFIFITISASSALNGKDCVIETQSHNEEVLEKYIAKLEQELETYKKIAYKLAEEIDNYDTYNENEKYCQFVYGFCILKDKKCVDCIIEWARKEVEKDVKD